MRFFISHSAQTERAKSVLQHVRERLDVKPNTVFFDADIPEGDEWRSVIYHELAICQAAVVLLDHEALSRRWVQREVDLLLWRRAFDRRVGILPVILDNTMPGAVRRAGFAEFTEQQFLLAGGLEPPEIADKVAARFGVSQAESSTELDSCMDQWFDNLEVVLERIGHPEFLRKAALDLGVSPEDADQVKLPGGRRFLAHQFLGRPADAAAVAAVKRIVYCSDVETLRQLVTLIAPTWVDQSASLPLVLHSPLQRFVAVLNSREPRTAEHYVQRATCLDRSVQVEHVSGVVGEDAATELFAQCETAVLRLLGGDPLNHTLADMLDDEVRDGPAKPTYLIVDTSVLPSPIVADVVERIRDKYRWLVVLVLVAGDEISLVDAVAHLRLSQARLLEPLLDHGEEFRAHRSVRELHRIIGSNTGGPNR